jgi:hypothetical protein
MVKLYYILWLGAYWLGVYPSWSRGSNAHNSFFCVKRGGGGVESQKQNKKTTLHKKIQDKTTYTRKDNSHKTRQHKYNLARASRIFVI